MTDITRVTLISAPTRNNIFTLVGLICMHLHLNSYEVCTVCAMHILRELFPLIFIKAILYFTDGNCAILMLLLLLLAVVATTFYKRLAGQLTGWIEPFCRCQFHAIRSDMHSNFIIN